jgi:SAM-dependent methyltransferase
MIMARATGFVSMSDEYNRLGVDQYYQLHARDYRNVHYAEIVLAMNVLMKAYQRNEGCSESLSVLDLACGSGEATLALQEWQTAEGTTAPVTLNIDGADPFTGPAYEERTGKVAFTFSFEDVARGCLSERLLQYDLCVCSFAMHLIQDKSYLWCTLNALARSCKFLALLSPHKNPHVAASSGWVLEYEKVEARVRLRLYRSTLWYAFAFEHNLACTTWP